jgi:hypothetical protein
MNLASTLYLHSFTFLLGHVRYRCSFAVADFLSPKISRMHHSDVTLRRLRLPRECRTALKQLLSLTAGSDLVIQPRDWDSFVSLAAALENSELSSILFESMGPDITLDNVSGRIQHKFNANLGIEPEVAFVARNFVGCSMEWLISVNFDVLCQILSHPSLIILDEDHLCEFILSRIEKDESQIPLLEFVRFEFVSSEILTTFLSYLQQVPLTLNRAIWNQMVLRLKGTSAQRPATKARYAKPAPVTVELRSPWPFVGIIDMLTRSCGGNVHDKGIVTVTPSAGGHAANSCRAIVDCSSDWSFSSLDSANEWICFDFKEKIVKPNGYAIRAHAARGTRLKSWVIEWSNNCADWFELDRKSQNTGLNAKGVLATFKIDHPRSCRFVRLRQTQPNWDGNWELGIGIGGNGVLRGPESSLKMHICCDWIQCSTSNVVRMHHLWVGRSIGMLQVVRSVLSQRA